MKNEYDMIIIGGGCAGLAAAMYAGRLELKTLLLGDIMGGTIILTDIVENYPGFKKLTGQELANNLREHALEYKIEIKENKVENIAKKGGLFEIKDDSGKTYKTKTVVYATGMKHRELGIPGEKEYSAKGVHTCALCDGAFYKNKIIAVVGGSDSAGKEALLLTQWAKKVYIIYRGDKIHPEPVNMDRINDKIKQRKMEIINNTNVKEIKGEKMVTNVILDKPYKGSTKFELSGLFVEIGAIPLSELAVSVGVKINDKKEIIINRDSETNIPGFFAAGDVVDTKFKQAITGVGEAVAAVYSAYTYMNKK